MTMNMHVTDVSTGSLKGDPIAVPEKYKFRRPYAEQQP